MVSRMPYCSISKFYDDWFRLTDISADAQRKMPSDKYGPVSQKSVQDVFKLHKRVCSSVANVPKYPVKSEQVQDFLKYNLAESRHGMAILSKSSFDFERDVLVGDCPISKGTCYTDGSDIRVCVNNINRTLENIKNSNEKKTLIIPERAKIQKIMQQVSMVVDKKVPKRGLQDTEYNEPIFSNFWNNVMYKVEQEFKVWHLNFRLQFPIAELFDEEITGRNYNEFDVFRRINSFICLTILIHKQNRERVEATNLKDLEVLMLKKWVKGVYLSGNYREYQCSKYLLSYREVKAGLINGVLHEIMAFVYQFKRETNNNNHENLATLIPEFGIRITGQDDTVTVEQMVNRIMEWDEAEIILKVDQLMVIVDEMLPELEKEIEDGVSKYKQQQAAADSEVKSKKK